MSDKLKDTLTPDDLRKSRDKAQVAFSEFAQSTRLKPDALFCFFEGKDNPYYVPRIKRFTDNYFPIKCGGKESVLGVHTLISNRPEYKKYRYAYFIDNDFNKPIERKEPPVFETPCYSIENLYVSISVFKEIMTNMFQISETTQNVFFNQLAHIYSERQNEFHEAVMFLNAWYACLIDNRDSHGKKTGVNLDEKLPSGYIDITLEKVSSHYDYNKIYKTFPDAQIVDEQIIADKIMQFKDQDLNKAFRGKYELEFMIMMIKAILQDSQKTKNVIKEKINFAFGDGSSLNHLQALTIFEAYAETPESLLNYLTTVILDK